MLAPLQHSTYEDIVNYIFTRFNLTGSDYVTDALARVLAFGPMHHKFEFADHNHVYNVYVVCNEELFPPQEYKEIEPDSTGVIHFLKKGKILPAIYVENYIRCDDGTGDILLFVNNLEYIYHSLLLKRTHGIDYEIAIGPDFTHNIM